jgi:hypothetical protein
MVPNSCLKRISEHGVKYATLFPEDKVCLHQSRAFFMKKAEEQAYCTAVD